MIVHARFFCDITKGGGKAIKRLKLIATYTQK